jgi:hypothetical protein
MTQTTQTTTQCDCCAQSRITTAATVERSTTSTGFFYATRQIGSTVHLCDECARQYDRFEASRQ